MKLTLKRLRALVYEWYRKTDDNDLYSDEAYEKDSVLVPDRDKREIEQWASSMKLKKRKKRA